MESNVSSEILDGVVSHIAHSVNRSALWDALFATRLVDKETSKTDLKRRYPDPTAWVRFVLKCVDDPQTREEALRALSHLVEAFVQLPTVDARIKTAVHKARMAAERQDVERLRRAISKLTVDEAVTADLPSHRPELIVYLAATTPRARENVAAVLASDASAASSSPPLVQIAQGTQASADESTARNRSGAVTFADSHAATSPIPAAGTASIDHLRTALRELVAMGSAGGTAWDPQTSRLDVESQLPEVEWPSPAGFGLELKGQLRLVRGLVEDLERVVIDVETIGDARERLQSLHSSLERLGGIATTADGLLASIQARARAIPAELDAEDQDEARSAIASLDSPENHASAIRQLTQLMRRARERRVERLGQLSELVGSIA